MVPLREVASWRSYVNIAATTGRSLGGPLGGYLTDTIGWRWYWFLTTSLPNRNADLYTGHFSANVHQPS
jgi:predicted MFS family arabinose efflux permease